MFDTSVKAHYQQELAHPERAITPHLPRLYELAKEHPHIVEFGVKRGASSSAFLLAGSEVFSYDIVPTKDAERLAASAPHWHYYIQSSLEAVVAPCDLLFIDSLHTYAQCKAELDRHADAVRRTLVFHDTLTFGTVGALGETGRQMWTYEPGVSVPEWALGIRPAIDQLMVRDPSWRIRAHYLDAHGLLVLERR